MCHGPWFHRHRTGERMGRSHAQSFPRGLGMDDVDREESRDEDSTCAPGRRIQHPPWISCVYCRWLRCRNAYSLRVPWLLISWLPRLFSPTKHDPLLVRWVNCGSTPASDDTQNCHIATIGVYRRWNVAVSMGKAEEIRPRSLQLRPFSSRATGKRKFKYSKRLVAMEWRHKPDKFPSSYWQPFSIIARSNLSSCLNLYNLCSCWVQWSLLFIRGWIGLLTFGDWISY